MQAFQNNEGIVPNLERRRKRLEELKQEREQISINQPKIQRNNSLSDLYKVYIEVSIVFCISIAFYFTYIKTEKEWMLDLGLLPWAIWLIKKCKESIQRFNQKV